MKSTLTRFMEKFLPEPFSGCWLWEGAVGDCNYGTMRLNGRKANAHRVAFILFNGPAPEGIEVMHTCDTPLCVNPRHLVLGTHAENMRDMVRKGRRKRIFSMQQAAVIRDEHIAGETYPTLAAKHGACERTIRTTIARLSEVLPEQEGA